ncbi:MAG: Asp23/Gls24 family envelope stress response protein [Chlamydiae bacterium]|jgi:uncharacterized alkaline shock family protein YloU|nr:Asp23/Gls24 family envelope stress response protein [Chlamydiota bacterium]
MSQFDDLDVKEIDLPDTIFIRDIESRVFQSITIKCLEDVQGVSLTGGTLIDNLLGREGLEKIKGVYIEQDIKNHSVSIKLDVNVLYGISLPEKAEEIQTKVVKEISRLTGLHVACVHVVFKNILSEGNLEDLLGKSKRKEEGGIDKLADEYAEEF